MLLQRIERHLKDGHVPPTRFGRNALGDPRLVFDLRNGRELRPATERRICEYLDAVDPRKREERLS